MPSLNDILGKKLQAGSVLAKEVNRQVSTAIQATATEVLHIPKSIMQAGAADVRGAVSSALNVGVNDIRAAAAQAATGDFSGALTTLAKGPQDVLGQFGAAFGLSSSGGVFGSSNGIVNTLQGALGRADPMMSFQWYCELPTVTPIDGAPANLDWSYVEEAAPSFRTYEVRQIYGSGRNRKVAGTYNVDNLRLNFYADVENKSLNYLMSWDGAILAPFGSGAVTVGGGFGRPSDYWKPIRIYLVDQSKAVILMLEYIECWPTNLDQIQLDSQSSTRLTYSVNFSAGDVFMTAFKVNSNLSGQALLSALKGSARDLVRNTARSAIKQLF
jgi:hypothetical protein